VWADIVLRAERQHAVELLAWSALSLIMATASLVATRGRRGESALLAGFAAQLSFWALAIAAIGAFEWHGLAMRDLSSAARLERFMWARAGLDVGIMGIGAAIGGASHLLARRQGGVGAGVAIAAHGLALLVIDLRLIAVISR
jgi:hypothetical protein